MFGWVAAAAADLSINEILADAPGADAGQEWVELLNTTDAPISLAGWSLESGTSALEERVVFGEIVLEGGDYLLVGGPSADVAAPALTLGNAGSSADAVRLVDASGLAVDTVIYGAPNSDGFVDDLGIVPGDAAPAPREGLSLQRSPDGQDSESPADFVVAPPTPGAPNPRPVPCAGGEVRINEILPDPAGTDAGGEWIELVNAGAEPVSLGGWALTFATGALGDPDIVLGELTLDPGAFLVVGGANADPDVITSATLGNGDGTDAIRLTSCDGTFTDTVLYGDAPNADGLPDERGVAADPYGAPATDQALARWVDGQDSDTSLDWRVVLAPTPGSPNPTPPSGDSAQPTAGCAAERPGAGCGGRPRLPGAALLLTCWRARSLRGPGRGGAPSAPA